MTRLIPVTHAYGLEGKPLRRMNGTLARLLTTGTRPDLADGRFGSLTWVVLKMVGVACRPAPRPPRTTTSGAHRRRCRDARRAPSSPKGWSPSAWWARSSRSPSRRTTRARRALRAARRDHLRERRPRLRDRRAARGAGLHPRCRPRRDHVGAVEQQPPEVRPDEADDEVEQRGLARSRNAHGDRTGRAARRQRAEVRRPTAPGTRRSGRGVRRPAFRRSAGAPAHRPRPDPRPKGAGAGRGDLGSGHALEGTRAGGLGAGAPRSSRRAKLSTVRGADRIVVMADGRVQEIGTPEELLRRGRGVHGAARRAGGLTAPDRGGTVFGQLRSLEHRGCVLPPGSGIRSENNQRGAHSCSDRTRRSSGSC